MESPILRCERFHYAAAYRERGQVDEMQRDITIQLEPALKGKPFAGALKGHPATVR